jgi:hypothetical protein
VPHSSSLVIEELSNADSLKALEERRKFSKPLKVIWWDSIRIEMH